MKKTINEIIGVRIKVLRLEKGNKKQIVVAEALGLSQQDYSDVELGKRNIDTKLITKVCEYYSLNLEQFYADLGKVDSELRNASDIDKTELLDFLKETFQLALKAQQDTITAKNETIEVLKHMIQNRPPENA